MPRHTALSSSSSSCTARSRSAASTVVATAALSFAALLFLPGCAVIQEVVTGEPATPTTTAPQGELTQSIVTSTEQAPGADETPGDIYLDPAGTMVGAGEPVLGHMPNEAYAVGYGTALPDFLSLNSMCANSISDIIWSDWGGAIATGTGTPCVSAGETMSGAVPIVEPLVASDPGDCNGVFAYRTLQVGTNQPMPICR